MRHLLILFFVGITVLGLPEVNSAFSPILRECDVTVAKLREHTLKSTNDVGHKIVELHENEISLIHFYTRTSKGLVFSTSYDERLEYTIYIYGRSDNCDLSVMIIPALDVKGRRSGTDSPWKPCKDTSMAEQEINSFLTNLTEKLLGR